MRERGNLEDAYWGLVGRFDAYWGLLGRFDACWGLVGRFGACWGLAGTFERKRRFLRSKNGFGGEI